MKSVYFFDTKTGIFHDSMCSAGDDETIAMNTPAGHTAHPYSDGIDILAHRVDVGTGKVVDYVPPQPSDDHEWNGATKRWQRNAAATARMAAHAHAIARITQLDTATLPLLRQIALGRPGMLDLERIQAEIDSLQPDILNPKKDAP